MVRFHREMRFCAVSRQLFRWCGPHGATTFNKLPALPIDIKSSYNFNTLAIPHSPAMHRKERIQGLRPNLNVDS